MSEEQADLDNIDALNAHKYKPLTPEQRLRKQQIFLKAYGEHGVVKFACKAAGISRQTYKNWRDGDEAFKEQLPEVKDDACDTLEYAAYEQAVVGVFEPLVSMGQPVYEQIPILDQGEPVLDSKGRPKMKRGKLLTRRVMSPSLLQTLLKANLPDKYKDKQQVEHSGPNGGPIQIQRNPNLRNLSDEDLDLLESMARKAQEGSEHGSST